jgi:hypothetical protein
LKHRQQFHRGDAEVLEVRYFVDQSRVGAALWWLDLCAGMSGESRDVKFVDDGLRDRTVEGLVVLPVVTGGIATTLRMPTAVLSPGRAAAQRS